MSEQRTNGADVETTKNGMDRGLTNRHVQIIAIAGTIGTGLFLGAGKSIHLTGPSIVLVYIITGIFMYLMMRGIGEMLFQDPDQHTFINFITKYLGQGWGYFAGWSYWISLVLLGMAELTAIAKYVQYFIPSAPSWLIQLVFLLILCGVNVVAVAVFGEVEFWFGMIKIIAILALIATAIFMVLTGFQTPVGHASLTNIFHGFKFFPLGIDHFFMAFQMVFFAYQAIEFVGITTSETKNPREVLPKAIHAIPSRIMFFYVGALIAIMSIFPWRQLPDDQSPFVMVFKLAGVNWAAALINFVVLTAAASSLNSMLYSSGRHLYQLARETPALDRYKLNRLSRTNVPQNAIFTSAGFMVIAAILSVVPWISDSFTVITSSSSGVYIAIYALTMLAHLRYRKSQDFMANGFLMPAYKVLNPLTIAFFGFIYLSLFLQQSTFIGAVGSTLWILVMGTICQMVTRKNTIK